MSRTRPILVVGRAGQVARCLSFTARERAVPLVAMGRPELDITDQNSVDHALERVNPSCVINAAAYTAVDKAEAEVDEAYRINCTGAAQLAKAAASRNLPFIHISTDYVFDGSGSRPYSEADQTSPLGAYGHSKRDGENAVLAAHPGTIVIRTSWVYSAFGVNFLKTMLRLAKSHPLVRVVNDQHGSPTSAHAFAPALLDVAARLSSSPVIGRGGLFHLTASGETTWYGFATAIFESLKSRGLNAPHVHPVTTAEYPTPAKRPAFSVLDCFEIERKFDVRLPHWQQSLDPCLDHLLTQKEPQLC